MRLNYRVRVPSFDAQCQLIQSGAGVALLPEATARRFAASMRLCVVTLIDAWMARELLVAVRRVADLPHFTQRLIKHLAPAVETTATTSPSASTASRRVRAPRIKK